MSEVVYVVKETVLEYNDEGYEVREGAETVSIHKAREDAETKADEKLVDFLMEFELPGELYEDSGVWHNSSTKFDVEDNRDELSKKLDDILGSDGWSFCGYENYSIKLTKRPTPEQARRLRREVFDTDLLVQVEKYEVQEGPMNKHHA